MPTKQDNLEKEFYEKFPIVHYECDDCWYSCPLSENGCCNEGQPKECNCGAEWRSKAVKSFVRLRESRLKEEWKKEVREEIEKSERDYLLMGKVGSIATVFIEIKSLIQ